MGNAAAVSTMGRLPVPIVGVEEWGMDLTYRTPSGDYTEESWPNND
jgi:hypothetical protein